MNKFYKDMNACLKAIFVIGGLIFLPAFLHAQCDGTGIVGTDCGNTPTSTGCQLDGFCYETTSAANTNGPPLTECGGTTMFSIDNSVFIAFSATASTAEINIIISSCARGEGLQTAIISDCNATTTLSDCNSPGRDDDHNLVATGLTVGQTYYILIDGFNGDECEFSLEIISGIDYGLASAEVDITSGTNGVIDCDNSTVVVSANSTAANSSYQWTTFNGVVESGDQTANAVVSEAGDYTVIVTDDDTGCMQEVIVTVQDNGVDPDRPIAPGAVTVCAGSTNQVYSINPAANADSYTWEIPTGATIVGPDDGTSITVNWATTATNDQICVRGVNGCGEGPQACFNVIVNPVPASPSINNPITSVCVNQTGVTFGVSPITGADDYTWTATPGAVITSANDGENITVDFGATATTVDICVTANNTCGGSAPDCETITINGVPNNPGNITGDINVCAGATNISYNVPAVTGADDYTWTLPTGASFVSGANTNSPVLDFSNTAMSGQLCVTPSNTCGSSTQACFSITILSPPAIPDPINNIGTDICQGDNGLIYSIPPVSGATSYVWNVPTGATIQSGQGSSLIIVNYGNTAMSGNICVSAVNACGVQGMQRCLSINVDNIPVQPLLIGDINSCGGATGIQYSITPISNADTYNWDAPSGFSLSLNAARTIATVNFANNASTGDICVTAQNDCGESTQECITVNIGTGPSVPVINGASEVCIGTNQTYTATVTGANTYNWTVPPGVQIFSGQNTASINTQITNTAIAGNICVTVESVCGMESDCFPITVDQILPPPLSIIGDDAHCAGATNTNYSITAIPGATSYSWTIPTGATITSSNTQAAITVDWSATALGGQICVEVINDCGSTLPLCKTIVINQIPTATFTAETPICQDGSATITYTGNASAVAAYNWNFNGGVATPGTGQGPIEVEWATSSIKTISLSVEENGCASSTISQTVTVEAPLPTPDIDCDPSTNSINFSWDDVGATTYQVNVISGPSGTQSGRTYVVSNLNPGDAVEIEVIAIGTGACGNSSARESCTAENCPTNVNINIDPVASICLNAGSPEVNLSATVTGGTGSGTGEWSGVGITDTNLGVFDPKVAGAGTHTIEYTYEEGNCSYDEPISIIVFAEPTASFVATNEVCEDETATITYTGSASTSATYRWDFAGGIIISGTGVGPYEVQWANFGSKVITLIVEENGCTANQVSQSVRVQRPLIEPEITCNSTTNSVEFRWRNVPNANGYQVNVISGPLGTQSGRTYLIENLNPGDEVEIEVVAIGTALCGNSSATESCTAENCPTNVNITIDPVPNICLNPTTVLTNLSATVTGGNGGGTGEWSGDGITDASLGLFNPAVAGAGTHTIQYTYKEGNCTYDEPIMITVFAELFAAFDATNEVCENESATITYAGNASASTNYTWDFDGGTVISGMGAGPYEVQWTTFGIKGISLEIEENGCTSNSVYKSINVNQPLQNPDISCATTTNSIEFSWPDIANALGYQVNLISGPTGTQTGRTYLVENLSPGDEVEIEVVALGALPCGNSSSSRSCIAQACPNNVTITIDPIADLCLDTSANEVTLNASVVNAGGNGTGTWIGRGITDAIAGTFDPSVSGLGMHRIRYLYEEANCSYEGFTDINVVAPPNANFSLDNTSCVDGIANVTYEGTANATAFYIWDFDGGTIANGSGQGPYEISWNTDGQKTVTLIVVQGGCTSTLFSESIMIENPIVVPAISCAPSPSSVQFSWDDIPVATGYEVNVVSGNMGTLNGNTYLVENLNPGDEVIIELTVLTNHPCGDVTGQPFSCSAEACSTISAEISGDENICIGDEASLFFDFQGAAGTFDVVVVDDLNNTFTIQNITSGHREIITPSINGVYRLVSAVANLNLACPVTVSGEATISVTAPLSAGTAGMPAVICVGEASLVDLSTILIDADGGGVWEESSFAKSTGTAFNASVGSFQTLDQVVGLYSFDYVLQGIGSCPSATTTVVVEVVGGPIADAGDDKELDCDFTPVGLSAENSSSGSNFNYLWTGPNGITSTSSILETETPGSYQLEVTNSTTGCVSLDNVEVLLSDKVPSDVSFLAIDPACADDEFGRLIISGVAGGIAPYVFSLNGEAFSSETDYDELAPADYDLTVQDAQGCEFTTSFSVETPDALTIDLGPDIEVAIGDSLTLVANVNGNVESVRWSPSSPDDCQGTDCLSYFIKPAVTTTYYVETINERGCRAEDQIKVSVNKERLVFTPSGFSPNGDNNNDIFFIYGGRGVEKILKFNIFNRWGDLVYEANNFAPNDPSFGWDGRHNGQILNPGVFIYVAEVEFVDGNVILYQGDVTLIK